MEVFEAIAKRYSCRGPFTEAPVSRDDLRKIVETGIRAPSACNEQVVSFVIVDDPSILKKIASLVNRPVCDTAHAMIVVVADHRPVYHDISFAAEDCGAAVENMLLAATALGYGAVWLDGALRVNDLARKIGDVVGVPRDQNVHILIPIGVPVQPGVQRERLPFARRVSFNRYGASEA
jgi:nitroreductase